MMAKFLIVVLAMIAMHLNAASQHFEKFTAQDGQVYRLRPAAEADFSNALIRGSFSDATLADRIQRAKNNIAGVFAVENDAGEIVGRIVTGRMPLGIQPWPLEEGSADHARLMPILGMYDSLIRALGMEPNHTQKHRTGAPTDLLLAHPDVHALTVILNGKFATISAQQAVVSSVRRLGTSVAIDPGVSDIGIPSLCVSTTREQNLGNVTDKTVVYKELGYYPQTETDSGLYDVVVTSMVDGFVLPSAL